MAAKAAITPTNVDKPAVFLIDDDETEVFTFGFAGEVYTMPLLQDLDETTVRKLRDLEGDGGANPSDYWNYLRLVAPELSDVITPMSMRHITKVMQGWFEASGLTTGESSASAS